MGRFIVLALGVAMVALPAKLDAAAALSIKNYRQIYSSMSTVTGVPKTNTVVATYYNQAFRRLSENGSVGSVSGPLLLTTTILASRFCSEFIKAEALLPKDQRKAHQQVAFDQTPAALTTAVVTSVLNNYGTLFWGRTPDSNERSIGLGLVKEAVEGQAETTQMTRNALLTACTNYLGSLEFIKQ